MKGGHHLLRCGVFCAAAALTAYGLRSHDGGGSPASGQAAPRRLAVKRSGTFAAPMDELTASVRHLLRSGDLEGAKAALREAAENRPLEFFRVLLGMPYLKDMEGMREMIGVAGSHLKWQDPEALALLDRFPAGELRNLAWGGYLGAQVGKVPDAELLDLATLRNTWPGRLISDAAEKRPRDFMALLLTRDCPNLWSPFFGSLQKAHPELSLELLKQLPLDRLGTGFNGFVMFYSLLQNNPTAGNLSAVLDRVNRDSLQFAETSSLSSVAFWALKREGRDAYLASAATASPEMKNALLDGVMRNDRFNLQVADVEAVMALAPSFALQEKALGMWLTLQPELDPADPASLARLPTERLRERALKMKRER